MRQGFWVWLKCAAVLMTLSGLVACASVNTDGTPLSAPAGKANPVLTGVPGTATLQLPASRQLTISGPFYANIQIGASPAGQVTVRGDSALVDKVCWFWQGQSLVLTMAPGYHYPKQMSLWLSINLPSVTQLQTKKGTQLTAGTFKTSYLQVDAEDNSRVILFGVARRIDLTASGYANVDMRGIQSRTGFIKANNDAQVSVITNGGLSAWASDHSTIYYYTDPVMVTSIQRSSGSVLRMSGIAT